MAAFVPRGPRAPAGFTRQEHDVNGVRTVVHVGGKGRPLVYWHGGGSWHGFDFAAPWLEHFQVIAPSHPGWGASADAPPDMSSMSDYVLHYLDLFDRLGLGQIDIVGISMGGWMGAEFASAYPERIRRLVLVAPAGLADPAHPGPSGLASWSLDEMYSYLVEDMATLEPHLPKNADDAARHAAEVEREMQSAGRLFGAGGPFNPKLPRWLHRATMPALVVWSKADRLSPFERHEQWLKLLPNARLKLVERGGHLTLDESAEAREAIVRFLTD